MMKPFTKDASWQANRDALKTMPNKQVTLFSCDVARLILPIWERKYPEDKRPRTAIETAELFVYGQATKKQLQKAIDDAYATNIPTENTAFATNAAWSAANAAAHVTNAAFVANAAADVTNAAWAVAWAADAVSNAANVNDIVQNVFHQTRPIPIPITSTLQSIAENIIKTRNFGEYCVILDNLEEVHNIVLPRELPLGLSHYVLFSLLN